MVAQPLYEIGYINSSGEFVPTVNNWFTSFDIAGRYLELEKASGNLTESNVFEASNKAYIVSSQVNFIR